MVGEVLSIGTELLLGQIVDTNAAYLARALGSLGVNLYFKTTVGDNAPRIEASLRQAAARADLILTSGGLGPTQDDLTRESVAAVFDEALVMDEASLRSLQEFFARRGVTMPERNSKQALVYAGGQAIPNPNGTAPGALLEKGGKIVISLPGPPRELMPMVENYVVPYLAQRLGGDRVFLRSRVLRFAGIGESALEQRVEDLIEGTNPTVAPLAHVGEVHLRLTASAPTADEALRFIEPVEREIRQRLGPLLYGTDDEALEQATLSALRAAGLSLAVAESCTGGLLGARITRVPGSSDCFLGGVISYSNAAKEELLGVCRETLEACGAVSGETAEAMAAGARLAFGADIGVSVTGVAGPGGGTPDKPVGLVYIGLAHAGGTRSRRFEFIGQREDVRTRSVLVALDEVRRRALHLGGDP